MTEDQMRNLVKECGLDWHRGFMPLFDGDPTNRYAVLIAAAQADAYERAAKVCLEMANERPTTLRSERACSSRNQRAAQCHDAIRALAKEADNA